MNIKKQLYKLMKSEIIAYETVFSVQSKIWQRFGDLCEDNLSINENWPDETIDASQKTGMITVQISDLFEKNLAKVLDKHLSKHNFKVRRKADSLGDLSIEYIPTGKRFPFELKTTQGKDFQGSTHSARKCDDYILIRFNLDYNQKFSMNDNSSLITDFSFQIFNDMDSKWWFGKETNNNSRTTLKVPVDSFDKWSNSFVVGKSVDNRFKKDGSMNTNIKFCKGEMKKLA